MNRKSATFTYLLFAFVLVLFFGVQRSYGEDPVANKNIVINRDFEYGLEGWTFNDISHTGNQCTGYKAVSNVSVYNNTAVIHSKYGYGRGKLSQSFNPVKPARPSPILCKHPFS